MLATYGEHHLFCTNRSLVLCIYLVHQAGNCHFFRGLLSNAPIPFVTGDRFTTQELNSPNVLLLFYKSFMLVPSLSLRVQGHVRLGTLQDHCNHRMLPRWSQTQWLAPPLGRRLGGVGGSTMRRSPWQLGGCCSSFPVGGVTVSSRQKKSDSFQMKKEIRKIICAGTQTWSCEHRQFGSKLTDTCSVSHTWLSTGLQMGFITVILGVLFFSKILWKWFCGPCKFLCTHKMLPARSSRVCVWCFYLV